MRLASAWLAPAVTMTRYCTQHKGVVLPCRLQSLACRQMELAQPKDPRMQALKHFAQLYGGGMLTPSSPFCVRILSSRALRSSGMPWSALYPLTAASVAWEAASLMAASGGFQYTAPAGDQPCNLQR